MEHQHILILDFGGQYNQLIARRVRECNVYCEVKPYNKVTIDEIKRLAPSGIILPEDPTAFTAKTLRALIRSFSS